MPPKGLPRPAAAQVEAVTAWIEAEFVRADRNVKPDPGRVVARRLNRAEYNNTIRDLLGVDFRPAEDFPQDDSGYGFDNIGDVLTLSPLLMEKYLSAAEIVSRLALQGPDSKPLLMRHQPPNRRRLEKRAEAPKTPAFYSLTDYDRTGLSQPSAIHKSYLFPAEGDYTFRILVGGARPPRSAPVQLALWIDSKVVHTEDVLEIGQDGTTFEFTTKVAGGEHWIAASFLDQFDGLPPSFGGPNPAKDSPATKEPRTPTAAGGGATQNQQLLVASLTAKGTAKGPVDYLFAADSITVKWFEVVGPFHAVAGPGSGKQTEDPGVRPPGRPPPAGLRAHDHREPGAPRLPEAGAASGIGALSPARRQRPAERTFVRGFRGARPEGLAGLAGLPVPHRA